MPSLNFDLAPPAKVVDGLLAVPMDIQRVTAALVFDGAALSGTGDATVEFTMGAQAGRPIFDLRQTIASAWLDGAPFAAGCLAARRSCPRRHRGLGRPVLGFARPLDPERRRRGDRASVA